MRTALPTGLFAILLVVCKSGWPSSHTELLTQYASGVIKEGRGVFSSHTTPRKTIEQPPSYLTQFRTSNGEWLTLPDKRFADKNEKITRKWHDLYCTANFKQALREAGIFSSSGQIIDNQGNMHSLSICVAEGEKTAPRSSGEKIAGIGNYSPEQICKAGLATTFRRDPKTMSAQHKGDHVQIKYKRPTDNKQFSYRCKFDGSFILTWDDSLAGARWYGSSPGDTSLRYQLDEKQRLIIYDIIKNEIVRSAAYTKKDLD